ncbi:predicted protein [Nematostella vectensis]|uniref:Uncharacterized protein n=1 Tax=Nematostella vectensis TaxID=45351 RepID=A7SJY1_NEMVE|nr:predicted protein [Nematostella vectensis]|eukprot:XP_001628038.1 predicted protein [Nematostella vectensis]
MGRNIDHILTIASIITNCRVEDVPDCFRTRLYNGEDLYEIEVTKFPPGKSEGYVVVSTKLQNRRLENQTRWDKGRPPGGEIATARITNGKGAKRGESPTSPSLSKTPCEPSTCISCGTPLVPDTGNRRLPTAKDLYGASSPAKNPGPTTGRFSKDAIGGDSTPSPSLSTAPCEPSTSSSCGTPVVSGTGNRRLPTVKRLYGARSYAKDSGPPAERSLKGAKGGDGTPSPSLSKAPCEPSTSSSCGTPVVSGTGNRRLQTAKDLYGARSPAKDPGPAAGSSSKPVDGKGSSKKPKNNLFLSFSIFGKRLEFRWKKPWKRHAKIYDVTSGNCQQSEDAKAGEGGAKMNDRSGKDSEGAQEAVVTQQKGTDEGKRACVNPSGGESSAHKSERKKKTPKKNKNQLDSENSNTGNVENEKKGTKDKTKKKSKNNSKNIGEEDGREKPKETRIEKTDVTIDNNKKRKGERRQGAVAPPLPPLPTQGAVTTPLPPLPSRSTIGPLPPITSSASKRILPPLPSKDLKRSLPPLPPKDFSRPLPPLNSGAAIKPLPPLSSKAATKTLPQPPGKDDLRAGVKEMENSSEINRVGPAVEQNTCRGILEQKRGSTQAHDTSPKSFHQSPRPRRNTIAEEEDPFKEKMRKRWKVKRRQTVSIMPVSAEPSVPGRAWE